MPRANTELLARMNRTSLPVHRAHAHTHTHGVLITLALLCALMLRTTNNTTRDSPIESERINYTRYLSLIALIGESSNIEIACRRLSVTEGRGVTLKPAGVSRAGG